ncbi:MAG TPA: PAS domain S-box protein [Chitinophagaceae bacterium]|nr:PAS domain S-box protein [Chitinophagaceae bacterium]
MRKISQSNNKKLPDISKKSSAASDDILHHLAFDNAALANIIVIVSSGKIILANSAACKLLGYSKKGLLTKNRADIFDIRESNFKKMLKQRTTEGRSIALVTAVKKSGKKFSCQITSAVFKDKDGIEKSITTIADISQSILEQKNIDTAKEKVVADNIVLAKSKQKDIDAQKEKIVANNIDLAKSEQKEIDTQKEKIVADNIVMAKSEQKEIDIQKEKIVAHDIAEAKSKQKEIDTQKEKIVADNIALAKSKQISIDIKKEKIVADDIALAKSKQISIDIKKEKIVADDIILAKAKADAGLAENNEWIKHIAKTSYDVMWDWDIVTGQVYIGDSIEEVFGYKLENNTVDFKDLSKDLLVEGEGTIKKVMKVLASRKKNWDDSYKIKRYDGSVASVVSRASIVRDRRGKAIRMIGATQDVSRLQELEKKLEQEIVSKGDLSTAYKESFKLIFNSSSDVLFDADLVTNEIIVSDGYEKEFGYKITNNMTQAKDWMGHIHPDDKEIVMEDYRKMLASEKTEWKYSYRFLRADNSVANILSSRIILRNPDGRAYRMIGSMHDISKQKVLEEKLLQEVKLKEKQIAEATEDAKETARSDIGKELHDNVNQLLGASKLYLEMAKQGGVNSEMYINRSSLYTLSAIEEIRKLSKGLTTDIIKNLGLSEAIDNIAQDTMQINPVKISCVSKSFKENSVNDKFKLNIFRIVQEQLNNILKHARATEIRLSLVQTKKSIMLSISDNGVGFDTGQKRKGIGIANIKSRATSYNGTADFVSQTGQGCVLTVTFPITDAPTKNSE